MTTAKPPGPEQKTEDLQAPVKKPNITVLDNLRKVDVRPEGREAQPAKKKKLLGSLKVGRVKLRHLIIAGSFALAVALPTALASFYMFVIAADQYHSSAAFAVRSIDGQASSDILGMFTQSSGGSTTGADSYMLLDYVESERMIEAVEKTVNLDAAFARHGADFYFSMTADLPIEERLEYWKKMVHVDFDHTSSILNLTVKAFDPKSAKQIASVIIGESERLINDLSLKARNGVLKASQDEVALAEGRLSAARNALRNFRDVSQEADPVEAAKLAGQLVASLEQQLTQLQTDLTTARTRMAADSPRIRVITTRIDSLEKQLAQEKQRFGSGIAGEAGGGDVASRMLQYEELETEREFAEKAYTGALASLEKARIDANNQQRYLATFIQPTLSEEAQYPSRLMMSALVFLGCLFAWGVCVMGYYNVRDRN
ncbi:RkpR, polysaccharide export protein [Rhizobium mongolense]|uniref:Capsular polysaccharide transport system permease protein n=1 Tax=Rhizobium mongolense TaxID=57676 RepID=A0A7W6WHG8_9HYPH|nr:RkpR, polysaccharide export protein [Rhizobium mongolense]MBB4277804.1 capsular polysaccharide transport system permease protein [Rhizobium mongolense]